jgi:hypothetical protein
MNETDKKPGEKPECFGDLEKVFPMTGSGLRETPEKCFQTCPLKTQCLKQAIKSGQGARLEEEMIQRGSKSGTISFFERWSRKKQLHRKTKKQGQQIP